MQRQLSVTMPVAPLAVVEECQFPHRSARAPSSLLALVCACRSILAALDFPRSRLAPCTCSEPALNRGQAAPVVFRLTIGWPSRGESVRSGQQIGRATDAISLDDSSTPPRPPPSLRLPAHGPGPATKAGKTSPLLATCQVPGSKCTPYPSRALQNCRPHSPTAALPGLTVLAVFGSDGVEPS